MWKFYFVYKTVGAVAVDSWKNADSSQERPAKRTEKKGSWGEKSQVNEVSQAFIRITCSINKWWRNIYSLLDWYRVAF